MPSKSTPKSVHRPPIHIRPIPTSSHPVSSTPAVHQQYNPRANRSVEVHHLCVLVVQPVPKPDCRIEGGHHPLLRCACACSSAGAQGRHHRLARLALRRRHVARRGQAARQARHDARAGGHLPGGGRQAGGRRGRGRARGGEVYIGGCLDAGWHCHGDVGQVLLQQRVSRHVHAALLAAPAATNTCRCNTATTTLLQEHRGAARLSARQARQGEATCPSRHRQRL
mmetsp:Transcript_34515/g.87228  ORF Transcript_34515/g.87228 Transcript_34515/m.87228 type:complete len:225 (+) Transcript_34515:179-853(+)